MADIDTALNELKGALEHAGREAVAHQGGMHEARACLDRLASVRQSAASDFLDDVETLGQRTESSHGILEAGQAAANGALDHLRQEKEASASAMASAAAATAELVRAKGEERRRILDEIGALVEDYRRAAQERQGEVLKGFLAEKQAIEEHKRPVTDAEEQLARVVGGAARLESVRASQVEAEKRLRASLANQVGCSELQKGHWRAACKLFETSCRWCPAAESLFNLAIAYCLCDRVEEGKPALDRALAAGLDAALGNIARALLAIKTQDYLEAKRVAQDAVVAGAANPLANIVASTALLAAGSAAAALGQVAVLRQSPVPLRDEWGYLLSLLDAAPAQRRPASRPDETPDGE
jgi:hypothetical protein